MKFFIPETDENRDAITVLEELSNASGFPTSAPCVYSLTYHHNWIEMRATVGLPLHSHYHTVDPIIAVLNRPGQFAVFLKNHGFGGGKPILIADSAVSRVDYFDD